MAKQKNSMLITMRNIATTSRAYDDLPALLALATYLNFLHKHQKANCIVFIEIICKPSQFHLSYEKLAPLCFYSEKTVRNRCKNFIGNFCVEYSYFKNLSLRQLVDRLNEYRSNSFLCQNIPSLNAISPNDISTAFSELDEFE